MDNVMTAVYLDHQDQKDRRVNQANLENQVLQDFQESLAVHQHDHVK